MTTHILIDTTGGQFQSRVADFPATTFPQTFFNTKAYCGFSLSRFIAARYETGTVIFAKTAQKASFDAAGQNHAPYITEYQRYQKAINFAKQAHGDQRYSTLKLPYFFHLRETEKVIDYFFYEMPVNRMFAVKTAALLHDVLEDTGVSFKEIETVFGQDVAQAVEHVTKINEEDTTDYERAYYQKVTQSEMGCLVKIADKCANAKQTLKFYSPWHAKRLVDGHALFQEIVYPKVTSTDLCRYLNGLIAKLEGQAS